MVVAVAIFALTSQTPEVTSAESGFVNDLLVALLGWIPGLYNPSTGLWFGIGIRHWAHAVEFGALGLFVALAAKSAMGPRAAAPHVVSLAICAGFSLYLYHNLNTGFLMNIAGQSARFFGLDCQT